MTASPPEAASGGTEGAGSPDVVAWDAFVEGNPLGSYLQLDGWAHEKDAWSLEVSKDSTHMHPRQMLRELEKAMPVFYAAPEMLSHGWEYADGGIRYLYELYARTKPDYTGRVTVPVLWDSKAGRIVNNESSEILRMLNTEFGPLATRRLPDLYPPALRKEIDAVNERVYRGVNNGVYRAGFATAQEKYDQAVTALFATLDWLERRLAKRRWLCGRQFTEADVRLFTTLVRFDAVYYSHFKCNLRRLTDYPRLWRYARRIHALPGVARTVDLDEIKAHYYRSMPEINPSGVVPKGPLLDFSS